MKKAENKYLRLSPLLKGEVNLLCATPFLLWRVAGSKNSKEHPKQRNGVNKFFGGCIQVQEMGEATMEKVTEQSSPHRHQGIVHTSLRDVCFPRRVNISHSNLFTV